MNESIERDPTPEERAGMDWWNALSQIERGQWLRRSGGSRAADAWAFRNASVGESWPPVEPPFAQPTEVDPPRPALPKLLVVDE